MRWFRSRRFAPARVVTVAIVCAAALTACGSTGGPPSATDAAGVVWLCRPGLSPDYCRYRGTTTVVPASGRRSVVANITDTSSPFDCFYVYPTVSTQPRGNANLSIETGEIGAAVTQASPFSSVCRVYAPIYRQRTEASLAMGLQSDAVANDIAYASVLKGWRDYLRNYNHGRPIIFLGHSQGAAMLIRLLESQVDPVPALRARTVSAILLGGNVAVRTGALVGSTFHNLPLCSAASETSCVVAYSSFPGQPPPDSLFGRPGTGVSYQSNQTATKGVQVACVDPAQLDSGSGALTPLFLTSVMTPPAPTVASRWVTYPDLYQSRCESGGGATWLQITSVAAPTDHRPRVSEILGPLWGYHVDDVALELGNLLALVGDQETAYVASHPGL